MIIDKIGAGSRKFHFNGTAEELLALRNHCASYRGLKGQVLRLTSVIASYKEKLNKEYLETMRLKDDLSKCNGYIKKLSQESLVKDNYITELQNEVKLWKEVNLEKLRDNNKLHAELYSHKELINSLKERMFREDPEETVEELKAKIDRLRKKLAHKTEV